jgi:two-component system NtrC family sensor kinase
MNLRSLQDWLDPDGPRPAPAAPPREKQRRIVLLRGLLLFAVGGLLLHQGIATAGVAALVLVLAFALSDLALALTPSRYVSTPHFELLVGAGDLILVGLGIHLADAAVGVLPVSCMLMVLVVALANHKANAVAGALAVGALHAWLASILGIGIGAPGQLALQILFLCSVGLYYGILTEEVRRVQRKIGADRQEQRELSTLLEILGTVTNSIDLRQVTSAIVRHLDTIVPSLRCSMLYIDESMEHCTVMASHDDPNVGDLEIDLRKYPEIREAIYSRRPVIVRDVATDPLMEAVRDHFRHLDFQSIAVIPLTFGHDVLGTLCLKTARSARPFSEREIRFCTAVARVSTNALRNAMLHSQVLAESSRHRVTGEKLQRILDNLPDAIVTTDAAGEITELSRGAEKLFGLPRDELLGRRFDSLTSSDADHGLVEAAMSSGEVADRTCRVLSGYGREVEAEISGIAIREDGVVTGTEWVCRDVSELRQAQLQLLQREKLSSIGEVISGVAHELNNPLSGVLGFSQLLLSRFGSEPLARELEKIHDSALRCQKIVKNLLSFSRAQSPERRYERINPIVERTLDLRRYQLQVNDVEIVTDLDPESPETMLDPHQLQQVLLNLINNAEHAIQAVDDRAGRLAVSTSRQNGFVRIEVTDNGIGMDETTQGRIFNPFFTTKEEGEGTGLGLSVSYGIVKEHGGRIYARSRLGEGTTFVIELPLVIAPRHAGAESDRPVEPHLECRESGGGKVLVVDDEPVIVDLLVDVLGSTGLLVDTATNGNEACDLLDENEYDLVITDVRMPRMNGVEFYRCAMSSRPELEGRVVFMTGDLIDRDTVDFLNEIHAPTLAKPLDLARIEEVIRATLRDEPPAESTEPT